MSELDLTHPAIRPVGYAALIERYGLDVIPNWHSSAVGGSGVRRVDAAGGLVEEVYIPQYWPGDSAGDHLEFALKYDGTNLGILTSLFSVIPPNEIVAHIRQKPTGKYARRIWFFYEFLTGKILPLEDQASGNYVDLLDSDVYYTAGPAQKVRRQRVNNNLLGNAEFCPMVRRTDTLREFETTNLPARCSDVVSGYSPSVLKRALSYLYTKETKSSFEIEHITPSSTRIERFVSLLQLAEEEDFCDKDRLIDLQNRIVDERFRDADYRSSQSYVGQTVAWEREKIHYVCPQPEDIHDLMKGLIDTHQRMEYAAVSPVVHAAAIGYGFVFLHPFEDGNGRIHRFLIHNILARRGFTPEGIMFPVSATMLKNLTQYDVSLELFSEKVTPLTDYSLDDEGCMKVHNDTRVWYRYIDMTAQAEALYRLIKLTIDTELAEELGFLANYDKTKAAIQEIIDMPDRQIDLFIRFCLQNHGRLSARKRESHFDFLSENESSRMEKAVQAAYGTDGVEKG